MFSGTNFSEEKQNQNNDRSLTLPLISLTISLPEWSASFLKDRQNNIYVTDQDKMQLVAELLNEQIDKNTGGPFAAAIFDREGKITSIGVNRVVPLNNSTAHAEMMAFQLAEKSVNSFTLTNGFTLATSAQPCAMCLGATVWAGVSQVLIGTTAQFTETLGFDEGPIHPDWRGQLQQRGITGVFP